MPWLVRNCHIGRLCQVLQNLGLTERDWTVSDLLLLLERRHQQQHLYALNPSAQTNPLGLLANQLKLALQDVHETPGAARRRSAERRAHEQAELDAQRREQAALVEAANTPAAIARRSALLAETRAQIRAAQQAHQLSTRPYDPTYR